MAKALFINRTEAELLVDVLEDNYKTAKHKPHGVGADLANEVRDLFGMIDQPMLHKESDVNERLDKDFNHVLEQFIKDIEFKKTTDTQIN